MSSKNDTQVIAEINELLLGQSAVASSPGDKSPDKLYTLLTKVMWPLPSIVFQHKITNFDLKMARKNQFSYKYG